jgi:peptidoglycan/LPS O-acetylase OafA/YrhL
MKSTRPAVVTMAVLLVALLIVIAVIASVIAAFAPADYKTYAVTTPLFLVLLFAAAAYYLWVGRRWARAVTIVIASLAIIGDLSVVLYYDSTATVIMNVVGLILAAGILVLLLLPSSSRYFRSTTEA